MKRREFITLIGGAAATWPLAARAQQPAMPIIGFLGVRTPEFDAGMLAKFRRGMSEQGYAEGTNVTIDFRWAGGQFDRLPALAEELVRRQVSLLVTSGGTASARAAKAATTAIPIVFAIGDDPVEFGLVASLNRPGGNITGVTNFYGALAAKQLGLLRELAPKVDVIAVLVNPNEPASGSQVRDAEAAAHEVGQQLVIHKATTERDIDAAFATFLEQRAGALLLGANPFFATRANQLFALAARYRLPTMYWRSELAKAGGLMSYGANPNDGYRQAGVYAGRILKGEKPADLPVVQPTKFEFVINLKTAKALGLDVPPIAACPRRRGDRMKRREFITLLGGAAAAWPLAARAQQGERMRRIGVLLPAAADDAEFQARVGAFLQGLALLGWTIGRNVRIDTRWATSQCRRNSQTRGGIGRARARRHPGPWRLDRGAVATGDPHRADRVPDRRRSGRRWLRRQSGAAGRQRHRFHDFRIRHGREMAGAAQADRAGRDASGGPSGSRHSHRPSPVRRHPGRGAVAQGGGKPGQRARRRRDRARRQRHSRAVRMAA